MKNLIQSRESKDNYHVMQLDIQVQFIHGIVL